MGGMIAELITVVRSYIANRNGAPGSLVYIEAKGIGKAGLNAAVFGQAGVFSRPPKGTRGIAVRIGQEKIALAFHNYQVVIDWTDEGGTTVFSTTADGATVKARLDLNPDGTMNLNGTSKYLVTWGALNTALQTLLTTLNAQMVTAGGPGGMTLDISAAKAASLRTDG